MRKRSIGVTLFGIGLILSTLYKMLSLFDIAHYFYLFGYFSEKIVWLRYTISWIDKFLVLIAAIGILRLSEFFRKMVIWVWVIIILTVAFKHPYQGFMNHVIYCDQVGLISLTRLEQLGIGLAQLTWMAVIGACLQDVIFGIILIYFFTRPSVKLQFQSSSPEKKR